MRPIYPDSLTSQVVPRTSTRGPSPSKPRDGPGRRALQVPVPRARFSEASHPSPVARSPRHPYPAAGGFPGTTLLQAIGFTAEPQCCDISFPASGSPPGSVLTSLEPHLDALLQQLLHYIISLVSLTLTKPCSCDPQAWRRGERRLAAGSSGHLLPRYPRLRLGYESSSPSVLYLPAPAISCPPPPRSLRLSTAQRWRSENFERPVDLEGSGDDDSFPDDELDDLYSGSGSGYFEQESGIETAVRFSPDVALAMSTTPAVLPTMDIQPVGTPFEELPSERPTPEPATSPPLVTEVPEEPSQRATTVSTPTATTTATTTGPPTVATVPATAATAAPSVPAAPPSAATTSVVRTTGVRRLLPLPLTTAATARATTPAVPSPPTTVAVLDTEAPTPRLVSTATSRPRALPRPATTQKPDIPEKSTLPLGTTAPGPTEVAQTPTPESFLTTIRDEPEMPVSGGPSGDFELSEEETTQPDTANEVVAVGGAAAKPSPPPGTLPKGARPGPGLLDNAIDSGSSAAQLPQKSILERKEVLVAVIVGGVVGALFAAFLVTLLIYRMKKKDEGSYTLEEPKQASVTYQKPDKQEEFYA
nr:syndecan-3 [Odocoileus virginianus texanus]